MKKKITLGLFALFLFAGTAYAFQTWGTWILPGTLNSARIHDQISRVLVTECGFTEAGFFHMADWMSASDVPFSDEVADPLNHFDDQKIMDARNTLFNRLGYFIFNSNKVLKSHDELIKGYQQLGLIFHAAQDFYAHTTHVEYVLGLYDNNRDFQDKSVENWDQLPLTSWLTLEEASRHKRDGTPGVLMARYHDYRSGNATEPSIQFVKSGYYSTDELYMDSLDNVYDTLKADFPDIHFRPKAAYCQLMDCSVGYSDDPEKYISYPTAMENALSSYDEMHVYLNKDSPYTTMGQIVHPHLGKSMFDIASNMASRETVRMWNFIEIEIKSKWPKDADCIIGTIKNGGMPDDCAIATMETPVTLDTGLPPGAEGKMKLYFQTAEEVDMDFKMPELVKTTIAGKRRMQGAANLSVDWRTGEIVGIGQADLTVPGSWSIEGYQAGVKMLDGKVRRDVKSRRVTVYVSGWLEDGAKEIRMVRVYTAEKEAMTGTMTVNGETYTGTGEPERIIDDAFGKLPLNGTRVLNDPGQIEAGPAKVRLRDVAWVGMQSSVPANLPAKYKQTRFGDGGPLAKRAKLPPVESMEGMVQEFRQELPGLQRDLAEMRAEMEAEPVDPEDAEMVAMQRRMLAQAQGALGTANQKIDEAEDKDQ